MTRAAQRQFFDGDFLWRSALSASDLHNTPANLDDLPAAPATRDSWEFYGDGVSLPWPANLPTTPEEPEEGSYPLVFYPTVQRSSYSSWDDTVPTAVPEHGSIYVILFGVGQEATEGIYTLRTQDRIEGSMVNVDTVVAFETAVDAERFATLLECSLGHMPTVWPMSWGEMTEWCNENNTRCRLESAGSLLLPPDSNMRVTDWERSLKLQRGEIAVLDLEPPSAGALDAGLSDGFFIDGPAWVHDDAAAAALQSKDESAVEVRFAVDTQVAAKGWSAIRESLERQMLK